MKWLKSLNVSVWSAAALLILVAASVTLAGEKRSGVSVPRTLTVIGCRVTEYVSAYDPITSSPAKRMKLKDVPEGYIIVPPLVHDYKDYEWRIENSELECKRDIVDLLDTEEIKGAPLLGADFSRHIQCVMASMSYAPKWAAAHPGWWPIGIGCPNPMLDDGGTPSDYSDDRIIGYKMPECPSEINGLIVTCKFDESAI